MEGSYRQTNSKFVLLRTYIVADRDTAKSGFSFSTWLVSPTQTGNACKEGRRVLHENYIH